MVPGRTQDWADRPPRRIDRGLADRFCRIGQAIPGLESLWPRSIPLLLQTSTLRLQPLKSYVLDTSVRLSDPKALLRFA